MGKAATVITATLVAVFFSGLANAGRVYVPQKSGSASTVASAIASRVGDIVSAGAMEGTYIPGYQQDRQIPVKVLNSNDFSARRTFEAATGLLKRGGPVAGAVAASAAIGWAVDQVGGFIDANSHAPMKKAAATPGTAVPTNASNNEYNWVISGYDTPYSSAASACDAYGQRVKSDATLQSATPNYVSDFEFECVVKTYYNPSFPTTYRGQILRRGSKCPT